MPSTGFRPSSRGTSPGGPHASTVIGSNRRCATSRSARVRASSPSRSTTFLILLATPTGTRIVAANFDMFHWFFVRSFVVENIALGREHRFLSMQYQALVQRDLDQFLLVRFESSHHVVDLVQQLPNPAWRRLARHRQRIGEQCVAAKFFVLEERY